jgi:predicted amino acid dehydrogenase
VNGRIQKIIVTNRGIEYTQATVSITGGNGYGAEAIVVVDAKVGVLRTIYYDSLAQRQIINANAGTIEYDNGIVNINDIRFLSVNSSDDLVHLTIEAEKGIIQSIRNTILTIDQDDPVSIVTTLTQYSS